MEARRIASRCALPRSVALLFALLALATSAAAARAAAPADDAFRAQVARFIEAELELFPERATYLGDHRYDGRVSDLSRAGIDAVIAHAKRWQASFEAIDPDSLSAHNEADRQWLLARLDGYLLWNEQVRSFERSPDMYLPTSAIYSLVIRDFAPLNERMRLVAARSRAALPNLAAARANLKPERTAKVSVEIALAEFKGSLAFFRSELPEIFAPVDDADISAQFAESNRALIEALEGYERWLRDELLPNAAGSYAIGPDAYRRMLRDADMVDVPLEDLERAGERELARLQERFRATAALIGPEKPPAAVMDALTREHPPADKVIPAVAAGLADLKNFVLAKRIATIPSDVLPTVRETPPFRRATTFASMNTPGPFEQSPEAYYYVTLPDPAWPEERRQQLLRFFSRYTISNTSVHEAYPGHYVQFLQNRRNPDLVRAVYASGANSEGWALYCEEMMLDEGLHDGDPRYRLAQLQMALMRAARYLVGLRMHTRGMTVEQAAEFFKENAYMPHNNAWMEAYRGTQDPGYLRYQLGKLMILKLREDVRRKQGSSFDLGRFHDDFLRQGAVPIKLIRRAMLGADGPLL